jgi:hypothetical protein
MRNDENCHPNDALLKRNNCKHSDRSGSLDTLISMHHIYKSLPGDRIAWSRLINSVRQEIMIQINLLINEIKKGIEPGNKHHPLGPEFMCHVRSWVQLCFATATSI